MRATILAAVRTTTFLAFAFGGASVVAQDNFLVKLTNPADMDVYGPGATCVITGFVQFPAGTTGKDSFSLRQAISRGGEGLYHCQNDPPRSQGSAER